MTRKQAVRMHRQQDPRKVLVLQYKNKEARAGILRRKGFASAAVGGCYEIWLSVDIRQQTARRDASAAAGKTSPGVTAPPACPRNSNWAASGQLACFRLLEGFKIWFGYLERRVATHTSLSATAGAGARKAGGHLLAGPGSPALCFANRNELAGGCPSMKDCCIHFLAGVLQNTRLLCCIAAFTGSSGGRYAASLVICGKAGERFRRAGTFSESKARK